jgi:hypothetical protein
MCSVGTLGTGMIHVLDVTEWTIQISLLFIVVHSLKPMDYLFLELFI